MILKLFYENEDYLNELKTLQILEENRKNSLQGYGRINKHMYVLTNYYEGKTLRHELCI